MMMMMMIELVLKGLSFTYRTRPNRLTSRYYDMEHSNYPSYSKGIYKFRSLEDPIVTLVESSIADAAATADKTTETVETETETETEKGKCDTIQKQQLIKC